MLTAIANQDLEIGLEYVHLNEKQNLNKILQMTEE